MPCVGYLEGGAGPSPACCSGVKAVKGLAQTTADKRTCCGCVKAAANRYTDLKDEAAQSLPAKCGVQLDIPISLPSIVTRSTNVILPTYICLDNIYRFQKNKVEHIYIDRKILDPWFKNLMLNHIF
ncbi:non-specific lipid-transfer protein a [Phtheirospermum japonicum]|uniref:Non-specific lipid-transfer protein n=1 Tax=Phtheirospermum japonicum TaxID=374723 RepID=A0A830DPP3_9LAMI|nr:non-specific lipid-transfer protein a [Phtheirospermum japonicum]